MSEMEIEDELVPPSRINRYLIGVALFAFALTMSIYVFAIFHFNQEKWGDFGSFLSGSVGALLTAFTFLALLYTIHIQASQLHASRQELQLTRNEMRLGRQEAARATAALKAQVAAADLQSFEKTLFDSLGFINQIVSQFEFRSPAEDHPQRGMQAFVSMHSALIYTTALGAQGEYDGDQIGFDAQVNSAFMRFRHLLAVYFRILYNIYRLLDEANIEKKIHYSRIIRAQIPDHALVLLFYNCLTDRGLKFQKYIVKYNVLNNLPENLLLNPHHLAIVQNLPTPRGAVV